MAELTIVFRLRFAVALALALLLLFICSTRDAWSAEYIVQMDAGTAPSEGTALVERLGGRVTSPELGVINGFGASLDSRAADRLAASDGVWAVSPNAGVTASSHRDADESGGYRCPPADATTIPAPPSRGRDRHDDYDDGDDYDDYGDRRRKGKDRRRGRHDRRRGDYDRRRDDYDRDRRDQSYSGIQAYHYSMQADQAWRHATGRGVGVAVIDTGIAGDLADFLESNRGGSSRVVGSAVTNPCASDANDHFGHGTHVAGLIAGNDRHVGVAPNADLISVKVSDDDGNTTVLDVIYGIQFAVEQRHRLGIRVINLSLSSTVPESYLTDPLDAAVESAWFSGIVVVAAAGNEGTAPSAVSYAPGNDPYVISAGGVDDRGTPDLSDDVLAPWSSRGVTQDGVQKPEVLAPGTGLVAPLAPGSDFTELCPECVVEGDYFRLSGTSMAAAVVSGAAALIVEENPHWSPDRVKGAMMGTLTNVPGAGGEVNVAAALNGRGLANLDLTPNPLVSPVTGLIDWTRASFRRASFRSADGTPLDARWSRASFRCDCSLTRSGAVDPDRSSFRAAGLQRTTEFSE
jgi:Subtilase family